MAKEVDDIYNASCNKVTKEVDDINNDPGISCFKKCEMIGFNLGSSSAGKQPRRPRRIIQPNSYYRNFQTNKCNTRFIVSPQDLLAYECILFYGPHREYASTEVINYDNVRVSYQQLATLRHSEKVYVDKFVINVFCRKMFKDKHPKDSRRHFFFSTVGDYLMNHEWNQTFLHDTCRRCFTLANGCFKFIASDYVSSTSLFFPILHDDHWFLFIVALHDGYFIFLDSFFREDELYQQNVRSTIIPNFVRAWDEFIGVDWNFHEFVIHYAHVPKYDMKFFSKYDDGVFVMKFLELWDPRIDMLQKFSSSNIPDIRVQYMNSMVFSHHNCNSHAKDMVSNHKAMLELKRRPGFQPSSSLQF
ncbi:uncharacterized protein LOC120654003 isoform X1 [Panicum virgatum]|uniref:Ubiquitin-like protease family profile domain-containing protein n=1 Tax=Panicum virgatum TaxID=38727 RepID=A0A8T0WML1_PANVG|nr:uncharacterized protein LOC120654003 isoform X1 [Panicum virgatum]KAG2650282.1 hypothetical protein PVAP13_1NG225219 [Panicum virgatum]